MTQTNPNSPSRRARMPLVLWLTGVAGIAFALGGCASSEKQQGEFDDRPRARPPAANELPPPPQPGSGSRTDASPATDHHNDPMNATIDGSLLRIDAITALSDAALSNDPESRANAIEALADAPAHLTPLLTVALADPNAGVRAVAATVIGDHQIMGQTERVRPLLRDPSPYVQASAIYAMARLGERVDQTPLADLLLTHPQTRVRAHVAVLLGKLGNPTSKPLLREAGGAQMPRASRAEWRLLDLQIAEALVRLGDDDGLQTIRAALYPSRPEDLEATLMAVQILGSVDDRGSIGSLINLTLRRDEAGNAMPPEIQLAAAGALAELGDPRAAQIAEEFVNSDRPEIRALAARVYGLSGQGATRLGRLLDDSDYRVRLTAASAVLDADRRTGGRGFAGRGPASAGVR